MDRQTLEAAATWYVQLNATPPSEAERMAHHEWLAQHPGHRQAWARVERLQQQLGGLPADVALPALDGVRARRRVVLKTLGLLLASGAAGWASFDLTRTQDWLADQRTATGERRHLQLSDGSVLDLNTATAVDIRFDAGLRQLQLHRGEILVRTAADPAGRPFVVHTAQGSVRALGTCFSVRCEGDRTRVAVLEDEVEVRAARQPGRAVHIGANQRVDVEAAAVGRPSALQPGEGAWAQGMLTVIDWRLDAVVAELRRYRPGYLSCADAVAELRLSGAFRIDDTDTILENLGASLPIRVRYLSRYWARIEPA